MRLTSYFKSDHDNGDTYLKRALRLKYIYLNFIFKILLCSYVLDSYRKPAWTPQHSPPSQGRPIYLYD